MRYFRLNSVNSRFLKIGDDRRTVAYCITFLFRNPHIFTSNISIRPSHTVPSSRDHRGASKGRRERSALPSSIHSFFTSFSFSWKYNR